MELKQLTERAIEVRELYSHLERGRYGRSWTREEVAAGFVGDVGDLMKLVMAESGIREISDSKEKLAHELADCLWCVLVLSKMYDVDLELAFVKTMDEIEANIKP